MEKNIGLIIAFQPDIVKIEYNDEFLDIENILIGISEKEIFKSDEYNALISLEILNKGEIKDEHLEFIKN